MVLEQERIIERIRSLCEADSRIVAAMLYGSFALGEGDRFSDVDCFLFFEDVIFPEVDKRAWVEQIGPLLLFYRNEFGNYEAIFENLVRAEFHFEPAEGMCQFDGLVGSVFFPSAESTILVDRTGALRKRLEPLIGRPQSHDTSVDVQFLIDSLLNWSLFGFNLLGRGEWAHGAEVLGLIQDYLLRMVRILEGGEERWMVPAKMVEQEISAESYARFQRCTAGVEAKPLAVAYWAAWEWGREMAAELAGRHGMAWPEELADKLEIYYRSILHWTRRGQRGGGPKRFFND